MENGRGWELIVAENVPVHAVVDVTARVPAAVVLTAVLCRCGWIQVLLQVPCCHGDDDAAPCASEAPHHTDDRGNPEQSASRYRRSGFG